MTTHRAQAFPGRGFQGGKGGAEVFDRVLCDVPCTGDGTVRKTFNIWRSWYPGNAMGLHPLQVRVWIERYRRVRPYARYPNHPNATSAHPLFLPTDQRTQFHSCKSPAAARS